MSRPLVFGHRPSRNRFTTAVRNPSCDGRLQGSADIDVPLTLLSDVGAFKEWLRNEATWRHADERAEKTLQRLLDLPPLKEVVVRTKQRWMCAEAYHLLRQVGVFVQYR